MKSIVNEAIHLKKNPFQYWSIAVLCLTAIVSLLYSMNSYNGKVETLHKIKDDHISQLKQVYSWYESGKKGPENRPWVDITTPFWAAWYANTHFYREPSSLTTMVSNSTVSIPILKRISVWSTPFDTDIIPEIQNIELRLPVDFDFTFVWLYLMPLVLIVLLFPINGFETDYALTPFIRVFTPNYSRWINTRIVFISSVILLLLTVFWLSGLFWIDWKTEIIKYIKYGAFLFAYTLFWIVLLSRFCSMGKSRKQIALRMISAWIILVIVIPSSIKVISHPVNPATIQFELAEKKEALSDSIYALPIAELKPLLEKHVPELKQDLDAKDLSTLETYQTNGLFRTAFVLELMQEHERVLKELETEVNKQRVWNWINPVGFVHAHLLSLSKTDVYTQIQYRKSILLTVKKLTIQLIKDELIAKHIDSSIFETYTSQKQLQPE